MILRDYQAAILARASTAFKEGHRSVLLQLPTGAGKTAIAIEAARRASRRGKRVLFQAHTRVLVTQTIDKFRAAGIEPGVIMAGYPRDDTALVQIGSVQTICRRTSAVAPFDLIISDECHRAAGASFRAALAAWPDAYHIGLSATPARTDGRGLGDIFSHLICGPSVAELIAAGWLAPFRVFAPSIPDLAGVRTIAGDYDEGGLAAAMNQPSITGDAIATFQQHGADRQALTYCVNIAHAERVAEDFAAAGIPTAVLHSKLPPEAQLAAVDGLRTGAVRNLVSVGMVSEGFDVPAVTCAILLRPTKSLILACQQWGRANRGGGEPALILDHAGNALTHGHPEDDRVWTLAGREKKKKRTDEEPEVAIRRCKECFCVYPARLAACPSCGAEPETRKPVERAGELIEIKRAEQPVPLRAALRAVRTPADFLAIAKARGYHPGWAVHALAERYGISREEATRRLWPRRTA